MDLDKISNEELLKMYGDIIKELKERKIIRSKNIVGDLGEYFAKSYYNSTKGLPTLLLTDKSTANIDAVSNKGERYSIKTVTSKTTGSFWGVSKEKNKKIFEYLIIVCLTDEYELDRIIEIDWDNFYKHIVFNKRMNNACHITITKSLIDDSKIIFDRNK
jgi:hypothetical protein